MCGCGGGTDRTCDGFPKCTCRCTLQDRHGNGLSEGVEMVLTADHHRRRRQMKIGHMGSGSGNRKLCVPQGKEILMMEQGLAECNDS